MANTPVAICRISHNNFKRHYVKKGKLFVDFFFVFVKCARTSERLEKKDEYPRLLISEILEYERGGYLNI